MNALSLLIVDDDDVDRMAVRRALLAGGVDARVTEAATPGEADEHVRRAQFDCILLDLRLPGTDGLSYLQRLRTAGVDAPVIILTGHGDEQTAVDIMKAGAADYLPKAGLSPSRLAAGVRGAMRLHDAVRSAELARRQVAEAEERYRILAQAIPQIVWVATEQFAVEYVNRQWSEYTGLDLDATERQGWSSVVHDEDKALFESRWEQAAASGSRFECQIRLRRGSDGTHRWHLARAEAFRAAAKETVRWFGTATDIEDQKQAESALQSLAIEAEEQRRRAEESNVAKDRFLAVLSHELRTPLNAILGWVSILRSSEPTPERVAKALEIIDRNARTQTQLIEDLLDVSRIVSGKLHIERRVVDLRRVIESAIETVRPSAEAKGVRVHASFDDSRLSVTGDAARLQQVVWNLLANAVKFTPPGGSVAVGAEATFGIVRASVEDTGAGIDPAFLPHVFERFFQADGHGGARSTGLGLGLSIVRHLVELHGGTVSAESPGLGRGARFSVFLAQESAGGAASAAPGDPALEETSLAEVDVLVVDDDVDGREMMVVRLAHCGAHVRSASNLKEARRAIEAALPDIIVSDIALPDGDGYSLIAELRARPSPSGGRIPAIALTGYAGLDDQRRAREVGFDRHVTKPVDLGVLTRAVGQLVRAERKAAEARSPSA